MIKGFNINSTVWVKLKEAGYEHWKASDDAWLPVKDRKPVENYKSRVNSQGFVLFQFWDFANIFGETMKMGFYVPFETTIYFLESDLTVVDRN